MRRHVTSEPNPFNPMPLCGLLLAALLPAVPSAADGWRTDGTGRYPDARPITEWSAEKNVIWATALPSTSNATPVIVGDKIFVCAEPTTLLCLSTADGSILWQRTNNYEDLADESQVEKIRQDQARTAELKGQLSQAWGEINQLKQHLQDKPDDADLKGKLQAAQDKAKSVNEELAPYFQLWYTLPDTHPLTGYATPTPVTDGQRVWALFGTGVAACYDLDGNRMWARLIEKPRHGYGHAASPLLVGGKLIVHIVNMSALDATTGELLWQTSLPESWGTPAVARIGQVDVVVTAKGDVVRVSDGAVLARSGASLEYCSPIVEGNVVYFAEHGENGNPGRAVELPGALSSDSAEVRVLWESRPRKERYYSSPVLHQGIIYACGMSGTLTAIDAATGQIIYEQRLPLGATCYSSLTCAGGFIFASGENGVTVVVKAGRQFQQVARNQLEPFWSCPVFVGDRIYIRAREHLYCLGPQGG